MKKGFTLIEVMIATVLLVSFMGAYLGTYHSFMSSAQQSKTLYQALSSCLSKFEEISGHEFGMIVADYNTTNFSILDNFGNKIGAGLIEITYAGTNNWTNATTAANWLARDDHASLVYDNKMWVMGGLINIGAGNVDVNDVWWTDDLDFSDGQTWTPATTSANWSARHFHTALVYDNKMWVMGGYTGDDWVVPPLNDVWYSVDGQTWYLAKPNDTNGWPVRGRHASVVYDNKMWVIGGRTTGNVYLNDVWYSANGINWTCATPLANWPARATDSGCLVYDNKIWIIGGHAGSSLYYNDVWWTNDTDLYDGQTWTPATTSANWSARADHGRLVYDNKMWVMGGYGGVGDAYNDVWYSTNGANWTCATPSANWPKRDHPVPLVYDNNMWILGGWNPSGFLNDVWRSTGGGQLIDVRILASFRTPNNRTTGEDENLDGFFNITSEDKDGDGLYDTPVQLHGLISERRGSTFLGRPQE